MTDPEEPCCEDPTFEPRRNLKTFVIGALVGCIYGLVLSRQFDHHSPKPRAEDWRVPFLERRLAFLEGELTGRQGAQHIATEGASKS